jgi:galactokinase
MFSVDFRQEVRFALDRVECDDEAPWSTYARGVLWSLQEAGYAIGGMDAVVLGDVPIGAGLSSSAALEVAFGYAALSLAGVEIDRLRLALAAQRAEVEFVGMRCGVMDQFIACLGQAEHSLLIDCRHLTYRLVPVPGDVAIVVADSGVRRGLRDSEYNARRAECEAAARHFGVEVLRDVDIGTFRSRAGELPDPVRRRARHVVTENERTLAAVAAFESGDLTTVGRHMDASHASLRDDFEVSCPELDQLVEIARSVSGVYGARLTGAGFGGCIVALAHREAAEPLATAIQERYPPASGRQAAVYHCRASGGASETR